MNIDFLVDSIIESEKGKKERNGIWEFNGRRLKYKKAKYSEDYKFSGFDIFALVLGTLFSTMIDLFCILACGGDVLIAVGVGTIIYFIVFFLIFWKNLSGEWYRIINMAIMPCLCSAWIILGITFNVVTPSNNIDTVFKKTNMKYKDEIPEWIFGF